MVRNWKLLCSRLIDNFRASVFLCHLVADSGVVMDHLLAGAVHTGPRGTLSQGCSVLLLLPLADDLLAAQPLAHGLLIAHSDLLIHLEGEVSVQRSEARAQVRRRRFKSKSRAVEMTNLLPLRFRHSKLVMAQEVRPHLLTQRGVHTSEVDETQQLLLIIGLQREDIPSDTTLKHCDLALCSFLLFGSKSHFPHSACSRYLDKQSLQTLGNVWKGMMVMGIDGYYDLVPRSCWKNSMIN